MLLAYVLLALFSIPAMGHENKPTVYETPVPNMPPDGWGGAQAHVGISALIGAATRSVVREPLPAFGVCMVPGLVKEVADYRKGQPGFRHGLFSRKDLISDAAGCAVGVTIGGFVFAPGRVWFNKEF